MTLNDILAQVDEATQRNVISSLTPKSRESMDVRIQRITGQLERNGAPVIMQETVGTALVASYVVGLSDGITLPARVGGVA